MRFLRGTHFDVFGFSSERRAERRLIADYENLMQLVVAHLTTRNFPVALELLALPQMVRGFGPIKMNAIAHYDEMRQILLQRLLCGGLQIIATSAVASSTTAKFTA